MRILTFDFEDWFHRLDCPTTRTPEQWAQFPSRLEADLERLLRVLDQARQQATFFCVGWTAERQPALVRRIVAAGHEIGSHSYLHRLIHQLDPPTFREDLKRSLGLLADLTGTPISAWRAPGFSVTTDSLPWVVDILQECGVARDASILPIAGRHGGVPSALSGPHRIGQIHAFPMSTTTVLGRRLPCVGGGYFRLLPYWWIRRQVRRMPYMMTYFHPHDFDPQKPAVPGADLGTRWRSSVGQRRARYKLERLLGDFRFLTLSEADQQVNWGERPGVPSAGGDTPR